MKKFKDFIANKFKTTPEGHIIIDEPIHFKKVSGNKDFELKKNDKGHYVIDEPIHFKYVGNDDSK